MTLFDRIRDAAAAVTAAARHVRIDHDALAALAATFDDDEPELLPEERPRGVDEEEMATHVVVWNMVNFGSGWFPQLRKRPGVSGARSLASAFDDHVRRNGVPSARWLSAVDAADCASVFEQQYPGPVDGLLDAFARAWRDLGDLLARDYDGSVAEMIRAAEASAEGMVRVLERMPLVRDVVTYGDLEVPIYKRAQITVSHLARVFDNTGLGHFTDVRDLTAFADNLVPHTLRMNGVLLYDDELAVRIAREDLFVAGEPAEVEIRTAALTAIEIMSRASGVTAAAIDNQLWLRGQDPAIKAVPRHRCRCTWY
jgi:hypothetical protein